MWQLLKTTWKAWNEDDATVLAAALAYFTAVSIAPLLVLIVVIAGLFLGRGAAQEQLLTRVQSMLGAQGSRFLEIVLENASQPELSGIAGVLSFLLLIWGSTNVFAQLQNSLNKIWGVERTAGGGVWATIRSRLLAFAMVIGAALLLLVSMVLSALLTTFVRWGSDLLPGSDWMWQVFNSVLTFIVSALLFAAIYKVLPNARVVWRDVLIGAAVTALLFVVGNYLLSLYLANAGSAYGVVGSLAVFLLWVFYSAQIFFFGAEFAQAYAQRYGSGIRPRVPGAHTTDGALAADRH